MLVGPSGDGLRHKCWATGLRAFLSNSLSFPESPPKAFVWSTCTSRKEQQGNLKSNTVLAGFSCVQSFNKCLFSLLLCAKQLFNLLSMEDDQVRNTRHLKQLPNCEKKSVGPRCPTADIPVLLFDFMFQKVCVNTETEKCITSYLCWNTLNYCTFIETLSPC